MAGVHTSVALATFPHTNASRSRSKGFEVGDNFRNVSISERIIVLFLTTENREASFASIYGFHEHGHDLEEESEMALQLQLTAGRVTSIPLYCPL